MTPLEQLRDLVAEGRWSEAHRLAGSGTVGRSYVLYHAHRTERAHVRKPAIYGDGNSTGNSDGNGNGYGDGNGNGDGYGYGYGDGNGNGSGDGNGNGPAHCPWLIHTEDPS